MNCMKCGREVEQGQVFCESCREEMEKYPVKPGTAVQLPRRQEENSMKKLARRRTAPSSEEQIRSLRNTIRLLLALLLVSFALIGVLLYPTVRQRLVGQELRPGQNYSSLTDNQSEGPSEETEE